MAYIFDIKRYSIHDGPGIRTTIFVKGCPLRCIWCHNPESWTSEPQRLYKSAKCIGCSFCIKTCPQGALELTDKGIQSTGKKCKVCGKCAEMCPSLAMEVCGKEWDMEDLFIEIEKERGIMEQGKGGVTLSGGEPLMHPDFTMKFLKESGKRGFHRAVDTTLFASEDVVRKISYECELFLIDLKCMDDDLHRKFTGVSNFSILHNLQVISSLHHPYYIRIPLICGVNATKENIISTVRFLQTLDRKPEIIDLLPYHDIGKGKHERIGTEYNPSHYEMTTPSNDEIEFLSGLIREGGLEVRIGG